MARLLITNLSAQDLNLQELYVTVAAGQTIETDRYHDDLHSMPRLQALWAAGQISVSISTPTAEGDFIAQKILHDGSQNTGPIGILGPVGVVRYELGGIQNISSDTDQFLPTKSVHRFTVSGGNHQLSSTPSISWPGAVAGQALTLWNVSAPGGFHVQLSRGVAETLKLSNATTTVDPGGTISFLFDGTLWVEIAHVVSTST